MTFRETVAKLLTSNLSDEDLKEVLKTLFCEPRQSFSTSKPPLNMRGQWFKDTVSTQFGDH